MGTEAPPQEQNRTDRAAAVGRVADADRPEAKPGEPGSVSPQDATDATAWFLSTEMEEAASAVLPVNVAPAGHKEHLVDFTIQVVDRDRIREIRRSCERSLPSGEREVDEMEANLQIAVEGLLNPNIKGDEQMRTVRGQYFADPAEALRARFVHKPGLIDQIAGRVVQISGYNDNDVKEIKAAGN